jgi:hypothetical protein
MGDSKKRAKGYLPVSSRPRDCGYAELPRREVDSTLLKNAFRFFGDDGSSMIVSMSNDHRKKYLLAESRRVEKVKAPALKGPYNAVAL